MIIGFANFDTNNKCIFEYEDIKSDAHELKVKNVNPYLVDALDIFIIKRRKPICNVSEISFGSMPNDGGYFLLTDNEKLELLKKEPRAEVFIKPILSAHEFLNGYKRWCLWLKDANPTDIKDLKEVTQRIENVRKHRAESNRQATQKLALFPTLFGEDRQPQSDYILIPRHSSETRKYIPLGLFDKNSIASDSCLFIENAKLYHFGNLMSQMHMTWVKYICGRIKSDFRYSNELVYNNYPWPENPTDKQIKVIENASQKVLGARLEFKNSSLADLYDPLAMPPSLIKAHLELDRVVDLAYRPQPFISEANRMVFLFELYEKYTADLFTKDKSKSKKKSIK